VSDASSTNWVGVLHDGVIVTDTRDMREVLARAVAGDDTALAEIWRRHHHLLLRYFRGRGMAEPDDLASQVWVDVARGLNRFAGDADDFRRWLFTIAARRRVDEIRRQRRVADRDELVRSQAPSASSNADDPTYDRALQLDRALELVRLLPDDQAEAVLLRVVADLDVAAVAEIMQRTEGHVRVLVHRGLKRLAAEHPAGSGDRNPRPSVTDTDGEAMYVS